MSKYLGMLVLVLLLSKNDAWCEDHPVPVTDNETIKHLKCHFPKSKKRAPDWVCHPQSEGFTLVAVGVATKSKAGIAFMEQMAEADARRQLAQKYRDLKPQNTAVDSDAVNLKENSNFETNETLKGSKIIKKILGPKGALYVLVGIEEPADSIRP